MAATSPGRAARLARGGTASADSDEVRLLVRVARMYHEGGVRQADIAGELHLSTARVSRLLARAAEVGIVRTIVTPPEGTHVDLEDRLEHRYGLAHAIVVDRGREDAVGALGAATARHLERTLHGERGLAIATWSASLMAAVEQLRPVPASSIETVAQLVGGHGTPQVQASSYRMIMRLSTLLGADPVVVPAPGMLRSREARDALIADPSVEQALALARSASVALVGIGAMAPSRLIRASGNALPSDELAALEAAGAVGDVCLRYFDRDGTRISSTFDRGVVGVEPEALLAIPRRIGVAGGLDKVEAIAGALRGGWVTTLVTDAAVARRLVAD